MQVCTGIEYYSLQVYIRSILDTQYKCLGLVYACKCTGTEYKPIESENGSIFIFIAGFF